MIKHLLHIATLAIGTISILSCEVDEDTYGAPLLCKVPQFTAATVDIAENTTLRLLAFNTTSGEFVKAGGYIYSGGKYLQSAELNEDGSFREYNDNAGLNGVTQKCNIIAVSPGVGIVTLDNKVGIKTKPNKENGSIYVTRSDGIDLGKYSEITFSNPLTEFRSQIGFIVYESDNFPQRVSDVIIELTGAGDGTENDMIYYFPLSRQSIPVTKSAMKFDFIEDTDENGKSLFKSSYKYIMSGIYAPKNIASTILGISPTSPILIDNDYLSIKITYGLYDKTSGEKKNTISTETKINISCPELTSGYRYIFKICISSSYITLYLNVKQINESNDWEIPGDIEDMTIEDGDYLINNITVKDWTDSTIEDGMTINN